MARQKHGLCAALLVVLSTLSACGSDDVFQGVGGTPAFLGFEDVWAFSPTDVWVVGNPALGEQTAAAHFDGEGWTAVDVGAYYLGALWGFAPDDLWAVGGELVLRYDGTAWQQTSLREQGAHDLLDIWGSSPTDVWAVGDEGFFHFDGESWQRARSGGANAIWGADADHLWAAGTFDYWAYETGSWSSFDPELFGGDASIWGFGPRDVYIAGDDEALAHWDGASWQRIDGDDVFGDLTAVWGAAPDDVWAVGSFGEVAHFDGSTLRSVQRQRQGAPYLMQLRGIHGSSARDVWAVGFVLGAEGNHGVIYHTSGGQ